MTYRTLTKCTPTGGTILNSPTGTTFVNNTVVTLTADPNPGYDFSAWTGSITGSTNPVNITMNANKSVCATFVVDNTPPVITRTGNATIYVECGSAYTDAGATASDNRDGNITSRIVVGGLAAVDESTPGTYTITYNVQDDAENSATQVTRTVIVQDTEGPVITLLGDSVIYMECGAAAEDPGATAVDTCEGDVAEEIDVVGLDLVGGNGPGEYSVTYEVADQAGNLSQATRTYVVLEDTEAPVITVSNSGYIMEGSTYSGIGATAYDACEGDLTNAIVVGGDTVNTAIPGTYLVTYNLTDSAGNAAEQKTGTVEVHPIIPNGVSFVSETSTVLESEAFVTLPLQVHQSGNSHASTVFYRLSGTASSGTDYDAEDGEVFLGQIPLGETRSIEIPILNDEVGEYDETLIVTLWKTAGGPIMEPSVHTLTIKNDDDPALTVLGPSNGSVILTPPVPTHTVGSGDGDYSGVYEYGTEVTLEAVPEPGFEFAGWLGDVEELEPEVILSADFNDDELDEAWTVDAGTWGIGESEYLAVTSEPNLSPQLTRSHVHPDMNVQLDYVRAVGAAPFKILLRRIDGSNNLALSVGIDDIRLVETSSGTENALAYIESTSSEIGDWYHLEIELDGPRVRVWRRPANGTESLLFSATTSVLTTNSFGFSAGPDTSYFLDNLTFSNVARRLKITLEENASIGAEFLPPDDTAPTISLVGDSDIALEVGQSFSDLGAIATDDRDGDITEDIVIGGDEVDTETHGIYTITYNVTDRSGNAANQIARTVRVNKINLLTLNMPTAGYSPEVEVTGGTIGERATTGWEIRAIQGGSVTLRIPENETLNVESGIAFGHWESDGEEFDGGRALSVQVVMSADKSVAIVGTDQFSAVELIDPYGPSAENRNEYVKLGTTEFTVEPLDAQLARKIGDAEGRSTTYYFYDDATVSFTSTPVANYAFDKWSVNPLDDLDPSNLPLVVEMGVDRTVEPVLKTDPHTLIVNISPERAGTVSFAPDPLHGEASATEMVEYFNPSRPDKAVTLRAIESLDSNMAFDHWSGGSIEGLSNNPITFPLEGDLAVTAHYVPAFGLSVTNLGRGAVTIDPPNRTIDTPVEHEFYPDPAANPEMTGPVEVTLTPVEGSLFRLTHWIVDGAPVFSSEPLTVTMDEAHEVIAVHMPNHISPAGRFNFNVSVRGEGTIHLAHTAPNTTLDRDIIRTDGVVTEELANGSEVTVTEDAGAGWVFDHWEILNAGSTTVQTGVLSPITGSTSLVAVFTDESDHDGQKKVTIQQFGAGSVIPEPGVHWFEENESVSFTALPEPGWKFKQWVGGPGGTVESVAIPITTDMNVQAYFEPEGDWEEDYDGPWYTLYMEATEGGTVAPGEADYPSGTEVSIVAANEPGWAFSHWEGDLIQGSENPTEIIPIEAHTFVRAVFEPVIIISIPEVEGGTVTVSPNKPEGYRLGDVITFTPVPNDGFEFDHWVGDLAGSVADISKAGGGTISKTAPFAGFANVSGGQTIVLNRAPFVSWPVFAPKEYKLDVRVVGGGRVHISPQRERYFAGETVKLVAIPEAEQVFDKWEGETTQSTAQVMNISMPNHDVKLTAQFRFTLESYRITRGPAYLETIDGGIVSLGPMHYDVSTGAGPFILIPAGTRVLFIAKPKANWEFVEWMGDIAGSEATHVVEHLSQNMEVSPRFREVAPAPSHVEINISLMVPFSSSTGPGAITVSTVPERQVNLEVSHYSESDAEPAPGEYTCWPGNRIKFWSLKTSVPNNLKEVRISGGGGLWAKNGVFWDNGTIIVPGIYNKCSDKYRFIDNISVSFRGLSPITGHMPRDEYLELFDECNGLLSCITENFTSCAFQGVYCSSRLNVGPGGIVRGRWGYHQIAPGEYYSWRVAVSDLNIGQTNDIVVNPDWGMVLDKAEFAEREGRQGFEYTYSFKPSDEAVEVRVHGSDGTFTSLGNHSPYEELTLVADPPDGKKFSHWTYGASEIPGGLKYSFDEEFIIVPECDGTEFAAHYIDEPCKDRHTLSTLDDEGGTILVHRLERLYDCDETVTIVAEPDRGYRFDHWEGDVPSEFYESVSAQLPMDHSREVKAVFEPLAESNCGLDVSPSEDISLRNVSETTSTEAFVEELRLYSEQLYVAFEEASTEHDIYREDYEVSIEHVSGPVVSFYLTDAWVRTHAGGANDASGQEQYTQARFGAISSFNMRDLLDARVYAVAYATDSATAERTSFVRFSLRKNGESCSTKEVSFNVLPENYSGPDEDTDEDDEENPVKVSEDTGDASNASHKGNKSITDEGKTKTEAGCEGDPVFQFSGEFTEDMVDLSVASPGFGFEWKRVYRSQLVRANSGTRIYVGEGPMPRRPQSKANPMGERWDYAYNSWIRRQSDGLKIQVHDGRSGREDVWEWSADESAWVHKDYPSRITMDNVALTQFNADQWVYLTYEDRTVYRYYPQHDSHGGAKGRLHSITDRHGNAMLFYYETDSNGDGRLSKVKDTAGRYYNVNYYASGRIKSVRDFTGRAIYYEYTESGDLVEVRDSRGATINEYGYDGGHRITQIRDGRGNVYLTNQYDTTSTDYMRFRVTRQIHGGADYTFTYEDLCPECVAPSNQDKMRVTVNDGEGNVRVAMFDNQNRMKWERVYAEPREATEATRFSDLPTAPDGYFQTSYTYVGESTLVDRKTFSKGDYVKYVYGGAADEAPNARVWWTRGNLRSVSYYGVGESTPLVEKWDYHADHGNYGHSERFVKRHEDPRTNVTLATEMTAAGDATTRTFPNSAQEGFLYNGRGQLTQHTLPPNKHGHARVDKFVYNNQGYLTESIVDFGGLALSTEYTPNRRGLPVEIKDPRGAITTREYDHRDRLKWERTPELDSGRKVVTRFAYDGNNNLFEVLTSNFDHEGDDYPNEEIARTIEYDIINRPVAVLEELDEGVFVRTETVYDKNGNVLVRRSAAASTKVSGDPPVPNEAGAIAEPDNIVTYQYNTRQFVEEEVHGDFENSTHPTRKLIYKYDANGNVTELHDVPSGSESPRVTYNVYDSRGRLDYVTDPMGNVTDYAYDANGNVTEIKLLGELEDGPTTVADAEDLEANRLAARLLSRKEYVYDALDRREREITHLFDPADTPTFTASTIETETLYDLTGNVSEIVLPNQESTIFHYDTANRLWKTEDAKGNTVALGLDENGNVETSTESNLSDVTPSNPAVEHTLTTTYDALNRPLTVENIAGDTVTTAYDSRGNVVYTKDGEDNETRMLYDGLGRLKETRRLVPGKPDVVTKQTWDVNSRLYAQEDPNGNVTNYRYDFLNRLETIRFADTTETTFAYDSFGRQTLKTDANGTEVAVTAFDALNRPLARTITVASPGGPIGGTMAESFTYDGLGNAVRLENDASVVSRVFDSISGTRSETVEFNSDSFEKTIAFAYDNIGRRVGTNYPGGRTVGYDFDALNRVSAINSSQGGDGNGLLAEYQYLGAGRVERRILRGNNTYTDYNIDTVGRVNGTTHRRIGTDAIFDERSYAWDGANNKTQRVEKVGGVAVKTYDYVYDALNRMERSTKTLPSAAPGTAGNWTGAMALDAANPAATTFAGGDALALSGNFSATFDPGTLQVFVSKVQGVRDESEDYPVDLQGYTGSQIDVLTPPLPHQGTFDLYASALSGATRVYSNPVSITYGPLVREYDLDGVGNRNSVETSAEMATYVREDEAPDPADAQMNQYTETPDEIAARAYDENGNLLHNGAALPAIYKHDYLDRIIEVSGVPALDSGSGVPVGSEFSDDFATGLDPAWVDNPAFHGGLNSNLWAWNSGGFVEHAGGATTANAALPRTNPDGDFWWVYARPGSASGDDVLTAHLRIVGHSTDTQLSAPFLMLDIDTDEISLQRDGTNGELAAAAITTADDTPYLIHAHVSGANVIIRRGQLGQPLETVLVVDDAPIQATDRFILSTASACIVDDVNIGNFNIEYAYDALGRRIEKRAGGDATRFVYDGAQVVEEWTISGGGSPTLAASYVYGLYVDEVLTMRRGGNDYYCHGDDMHNVVKLTDEDGEVVEGYDYGDYGQPEFYDAAGNLLDVTASALGNPFLFNGHEWNPDTGLYWYRTRYMDPELGRFVARDTIGLWGDEKNLGNPYTYLSNNPWSGLDPYGQWWWDADYIQEGGGALLGFYGAGAAGNAWAGAGVGALQGAAVVLDTPGQLVEWAGIGQRPLRYLGAYNDTDPGIFASRVSSGVGWTAAAGAAGLSKAGWDVAITGARAGELIHAGEAAREALSDDPWPTVYDGPYEPTNWPEEQGTDGSGDSGKTYQTYTKRNPYTGEVYSGRTSGTGTPEENVEDRDRKHHMNPKGFGPAKLDKSSTSYDAIRGREQRLIDKHGGAKSCGGKSGNQNNGIRPDHPDRDTYFKAAQREFGSI